jgi:Ribbon-helix-helix protein, copG family
MGVSHSLEVIRPVSVRLPDDLAAQLTAASARRGVGITELIREGIVFRLAFEALADASGEDAHAIIERALREIGQRRPSPGAPADPPRS